MFLEARIKYLYIFLGILSTNILASNGLEYYTEKPSFFKTCKLSDPEFSKCSTESHKIMIEHLLKGDFPEITKKLGPIDPSKLEKIIFKPDSNQAISLTAELDDLIFKGLSKMIFKDSRVNKNNLGWQTKILLPKVSLNGNYKMNGKILLLPINGHGKFSVDIDNLDIVLRTTVDLYEKGDFTFFNVTSVRVQLDMSGMHVNFENLFNGQNEEIERTTNEFFNENWRELFTSLQPVISESVERVLLKVFREIFNVLPGNFYVEDLPKSTEIKNKSKRS